MEIDCYKIKVDCQYNDDEDIKCGGPYCLGYDFFVETYKVDEMIDFVKATCDELEVPIIVIYYEKDMIYKKEDKNIWTKDKIFKCIENNDAGLNLNSNYSL